MDIDRLLTSTRSARRSLDLDAPVDHGVVKDCLRIGMQAANGSNQQSWRWLVVAGEDLGAGSPSSTATPTCNGSVVS